MKPILIVLLFSLPLISLVAFAKKDTAFCPSLPSEVTDVLPFLPNNPDTASAQKCTKNHECGWCDKGKLTGIKLLGVKHDDVKISEFCWYANLFHLKNNTIKAANSEAKVVCNGPPRYRQHTLTGGWAITFFVFFILIALSALACCCLCLTSFFLRPRYGRGAYEKL